MLWPYKYFLLSFLIFNFKNSAFQFRDMFVICLYLCSMPREDPSLSTDNLTSWYRATPCVTLTQYSTREYFHRFCFCW